MFIIFLCTYIKTGNKYCQKNKENFKKKYGKGTKIFLKKKKKKNIISSVSE